MEITDGTHKTIGICPVTSMNKIKRPLKSSDIISFKAFKSQIVSSKNTLVLHSEVEIVYDNAVYDETRPILDYNQAKAAGQKLNPAYESHTVIKLLKDENQDFNIDEIDLNSG